MKISEIIPALTAIAVATIIVLLIYAAVQQNYRMSANDPQVGVANDIRHRLENGQSIEGLFPADSLDISRSLGLFAVLYDGSGNPLRSSATLDGIAPRLPQGVFDHIRKNGEDRITWQPRQGVRMAMVVDPVATGPVKYVAVGRSLREVEIRESNLGWMVFLSWIAVIAVIVLAWLLSLKGIFASGKPVFFFLKWGIVAANILFLLWVLYNAVDEGFRGTWPEKLSAVALTGLLAVNSLLVLKTRMEQRAPSALG